MLSIVSGPDQPRARMRPWLPPSLRRVWRGPGVLQIGTDPERAVTLRAVTSELAALIASFDGLRELDECIATSGADRTLALATVQRLRTAGLVRDLGQLGDERHTASPLEGTLLGETAGRSLSSADDDPMRAMRLRRAAQIAVVGGRRAGPLIAGLLASSGIGRVGIAASGTVTVSDVLLGGVGREDVGRHRQSAIIDAVQRIAPACEVRRLSPSDSPDLVVLVDGWPQTGERVRLLHRLRRPYLAAGVRERRAVIGPFVIPGRTSCLECQDRARTDLDPGWTAIALQLRDGRERASDGGEAAIAAMCAALAVTQALQWVDGERSPETIDTTLEIGLPDLVLRRRHWSPHPACACLYPDRTHL